MNLFRHSDCTDHVSLQAAVIGALSALCEEFYQTESGKADEQIQGRMPTSKLMA